ncbi:MAG: hypothetical protein ABI743_12985 [bacterium]
MLHRLALLFMLVCALAGTACKGSPPDVPYIPVSNYVAINLSQTSVTLDPGGAIDLHAFAIQIGTIQPVELTGFLTWKSSDTSVAIVNEVGVVFAIAPGIATVTGEIQGLVSQSCTVNVTGVVVPPGTAPSLQALVIRQGDGTAITSAIHITTDDTAELSVVGLYSDGTTLPITGFTYRVSDPRIATVRFDGLFEPIKAGIVSVNARGDFEGRHLESNYVLFQITQAP